MLKSGRFEPPSLEDVKEYCKQENLLTDAEAFHNYYTATGWYIGKKKIKNWQAAVRTWHHREQKKNNGIKPPTGRIL